MWLEQTLALVGPLTISISIFSMPLGLIIFWCLVANLVCWLPNRCPQVRCLSPLHLISKYSRLLRLPLGLPERSAPDVDVHAHVVPDDEAVSGAEQILDPPLQQCVAPVRRHGGGARLPAAEIDAGQGSADELARVRDQHRRSSDLAHGRSDEVAEDELDVDVMGPQLSGQGSAPLLQERLRAAVGRQVRRRRPAAEAAHGEDKAASALLHARCDQARRLECTEAVDSDDVPELRPVRLGEGNGDAVALPDVVDEDGNVEPLYEGRELRVVGVRVARIVHREHLCLHVAVLGLDFCGQRIQLRLRARHEHKVEALRRESPRKLLTQAIGSTRYDSPAALLAVLSELQIAPSAIPHLLVLGVE